MPVVSALAKRHNCQVDFYTSEYCRATKSLLLWQSYIHDVIIPDGYTVTSYGQGVQPWQMPVDEDKYEKIYQLGLWRHPDKDMVSFYAETAGIEPDEFVIDCPDGAPGYPFNLLEQRPILISCSSIWPYGHYRKIIDACVEFAPVIQLGWPGEELLRGVSNEYLPGFLTTATLMKHARLFTSGTGANTCLSIAFPNMWSVINLPQVGIDWRHNVHRDKTHYIMDYSIDKWIEEIRAKL